MEGNKEGPTKKRGEKDRRESRNTERKTNDKTNKKSERCTSFIRVNPQSVDMLVNNTHTQIVFCNNYSFEKASV